MALFITEGAERDVAEQVEYLAERNPDAARRYAVAVRETFEFVERMPGVGSLREFKNPRLTGVRMRVVLGFDRYLVFFREVDGGVEIIRVLHSARDIQSILEAEE